MLSRWNPWSDLLSQDWDERAFGTTRFSPAVDIVEHESDILLKAELPGMKPEDVTINLEGNMLTISGERRFEHEEKEGGYQRIERRYGSFTRSFTLPENVDREKLDAEMNDGILTVRLPKSEEYRPRKIEVRTSGARDKEKRQVNVQQQEPRQRPS
jgi:HSP20 family protein